MTSWIELKGLREKRNQKLAEAREILKRSTDAQRAMTDEEDQAFAALHQSAEDLLKQIEALMQQDQAEDQDEEQNAERFSRPQVETRDAGPTSEQVELRNKAFHKRLRGLPLSGAELRALTVGGSGNGAEAVPQDFWNGFYQKLRNTGSIRVAGPRVDQASDGRSIPYPVFDDTSNTGEIISVDGTNATGSATPSTSKLTLGGYVFSSKVFPLAKDFIQDAAGDPVGAVQKMAADRISAILDQYLTTGSGSGQPQGAVTGSSLGKTTAGTAAVTYNEVLDFINSLTPPYREGAVLMFNDNTLLAIKKLVDGSGNSLWFSGYANNAGNAIAPTIAGVKYVINPYMADLGTGNKFALYGNFSQGYIIRDVAGADLVVDPYTSMAKYMINYVMFSRHDGGVCNSSAIKHMKNA
jgi:HK97 family phage major capsid protein